ncbi:hypothetical protein ACQKP3_15520 [Vibrio sp. DNB22_10_4]
MKKQLGVVTLMITGLLLVVALIVTLGAYKTSLYEIKRAQNEVEARKTYWVLEGGVECGLAQFIPTLSVPAEPKTCDSAINITPSFAVDAITKEVVLSAKMSSHEVSRRFIPSSNNLKPGAIQSTGSFVVNSSVNISTPDPGDKLEDGRWDCTAVRFGGSFKANGAITNSGVIHGISPYEGFEHNNKDCAEMTVVSANCSSDTDPTCLKQDFKKDTELDVFKDFFGVDASYHNSIRDSGEFTVIELKSASESAGPKQCGSKIINSLNTDNLKIWIEGSCVISSDELGSIKTALNPAGGTKKAMTLVVHEGLLALHGATAINGVVFHFNQDFSPTKSAWDALELADSAVAHFPEDYGSAAYYQGGSFNISGGVFFDYPKASHASLFRDSLSFHYNRDVIRDAQGSSSLFTWKKGAWRDF